MKNQIKIPFDDLRKYNKRFWLTPPHILEMINTTFEIKMDVCPHPLPNEYNSIFEKWSSSNYCNPPFYRDPPNFTSPIDFVHKAISEKENGNSTIFLLPTQNIINVLLNAGSRIFPIPRPRFLEISTGEIQRKPGNACLFVLGFDTISNSEILSAINKL